MLSWAQKMDMFGRVVQILWIQGGILRQEVTVTRDNS